MQLHGPKAGPGNAAQNISNQGAFLGLLGA